MKHIQLDCKRGGKERGAILSVGPKGDITLEEAEILISERMASEYTQPVVSEVDTAEVTRLTEELATAKSEAQANAAILNEAHTASQAEVIRLTEENTRLSGELEVANSKVEALTEENTRLSGELEVANTKVTALTEENAKLVLTAPAAKKG